MSRLLPILVGIPTAVPYVVPLTCCSKIENESFGFIHQLNCTHVLYRTQEPARTNARARARARAGSPGGGGRERVVGSRIWLNRMGPSMTTRAVTLVLGMLSQLYFHSATALEAAADAPHIMIIVVE
eukprot:COSAG02_NODE_3059_length_7451_cov_11.870919_8_plen_127_part_00